MKDTGLLRVATSCDRMMYWQIDCLRANKDHNIAPILISRKDGRSILCVDVQGYICLTDHPVWRNFSADTAIAVIKALCGMAFWCREHFLDPRNLIGIASGIYYRKNAVIEDIPADLRFIYRPVINTDQEDPVRAFIKDLLTVHSHLFSDEECQFLDALDCDTVSGDMRFPKEAPKENDAVIKKSRNPMKSAGIYLLAGIPLAEALIIGGCVYVVKSTVSLPNRTVVFIPVVILLALCVALNLWLTLSNKSRLKILFTKSSSKFKAPGNKKTILSSDPEHTVMLTDEIINPAIGILCQGIPGTPEEGTGRKAYVMTEEFLIGRDPAQCDFVIDSSAVGRTHARIRRIGNSFFIADLNSRNGTFLNQKRLKKTEETLLPEKCTIKFASSEFFFLMT